MNQLVKVLCFLFVAVLVATIPMQAAAEAIANFTGGNDDTTNVDAFHGIAGDGWTTPWFENQLLPSGDTLSATNTVTDTNPVDGGGNYLSSTVTTSVAAGSKVSYALLRQFQDGIDRTAPFTIDFTVRIDEDVTGFDAYHDRYSMSDGANDVTGASGDASWQIMAHGAGGSACYADAAGYWTFYDGDSNGTYYGTNPDKLLNTGIALTTGGVYTISVKVDPVAETWDGSISDGVDTFSRSSMGWRTSRNGTTYSALVFGTKADAGTTTRQWSIDSIAMIQVPEPATIVLLGGLLMGVLLARRRR